MAKQVKNKKPITPATKADTKIHRYLIAFPLIAFMIKMIVMFNIQGGGWYGADGENYTAGVDGLLNSGFYSEEPKLSYWPAGYPLLLWPLAIISISKFFYLISFLQSIFFAYATFFFTKSLQSSSLRKFAFLTSLIISFNPTLSLSTLTVGYEGPIASAFMMILGLTIKQNLVPFDRGYWFRTAAISGWFALAIFMQPRFMLVAALYFIYLVIKLGNVKTVAASLIIGFLISSIGPAIMIFRNAKVINQATISTNLGTTMSIGAGDSTSGGYARSGPEVPCVLTPPATNLSENDKIRCVVKWYLSNPIKTLTLSYNKSQYFWSPWSGPLANGTMARNPWLKIAPTQSLRKTQEGSNLVGGLIGKVISFGWIIGQLFFFIWGYRELRKLGATEKKIANFVALPIVMSWAITIGTIGDHRFRVPTMALSLFLQSIGFLALRNKITKVL